LFETYRPQANLTHVKIVKTNIVMNRNHDNLVSTLECSLTFWNLWGFLRTVKDPVYVHLAINNVHVADGYSDSIDNRLTRRQRDRWVWRHFRRVTSPVERSRAVPASAMESDTTLLNTSHPHDMCT